METVYLTRGWCWSVGRTIIGWGWTACDPPCLLDVYDNPTTLFWLEANRDAFYI